MNKTKGLSGRYRKKIEESGQTSLSIQTFQAKSSRAELVDDKKEVRKSNLKTYSKWPEIDSIVLVVLNPHGQYGRGTDGGDAIFSGKFLGVSFDANPLVGIYGRVRPEEVSLSASLKAWLPSEVRVKLGDLRRIKK